MKSETDEDFKMDIQAYIDSLLNRKKHLANILNLIKIYSLIKHAKSRVIYVN